MATAPIWKVYDNEGVYIASCKLPEYAAMLIAGMGQEGAQIRYDHSKVVWTEGKEDISASESYDVVARTARERAREYRLEKYARWIR